MSAQPSSLQAVRPWRTIERRPSRKIKVGAVEVGGDMQEKAAWRIRGRVVSSSCAASKATAPGSCIRTSPIEFGAAACAARGGGTWRRHVEAARG